MLDDANREDFVRGDRGETMTRGTHQVKGNEKVPRLYIIK